VTICRNAIGGPGCAFAIIGPLLAAPPAEGELQSALSALAGKTWRHPFTGLEIRFGCSTIERWLYAAERRKTPSRRCVTRCVVTSDGSPSLSAQAVAGTQPRSITRNPSWAAKLHSDNLRVILCQRPQGMRPAPHPMPKRTALSETPRDCGVSAPHKRCHRRCARRPRSARAARMRSYEVEHVLQTAYASGLSITARRKVLTPARRVGQTAARRVHR